MLQEALTQDEFLIAAHQAAALGTRAGGPDVPTKKLPAGPRTHEQLGLALQRLVQSEGAALQMFSESIGFRVSEAADVLENVDQAEAYWCGSEGQWVALMFEAGDVLLIGAAVILAVG